MQVGMDQFRYSTQTCLEISPIFPRHAGGDPVESRWNQGLDHIPNMRVYHQQQQIAEIRSVRLSSEFQHSTTDPMAVRTAMGTTILDAAAADPRIFFQK